MPPPVAGLLPWYRRPVWWVFFSAIVLRLLVLQAFSATPYFLQQRGDMLFYHSWALRLLEGQWTDHHAFYGLPGYAFLLAGIYKVVGSSAVARVFAVALLQIVLEAITAAIIFKLAKKICESEMPATAEAADSATQKTRFDLLAWLLPTLASLAWITFVPAQSFSIILMPTAWVVCAYWLGVWRAMQPGETTVWRPWLPVGVAIGAVSMLVATITFLLPLLLVRLGLSVAPTLPWRQRLPRALAAAALLVSGVFVGSSPAWIHNYFIAHDPVLLSAHGGLNFWMGNNPAANGYPKIPPGLRASQEGLLRDSISWVEKEAGHPLRRSEVSQYWGAKAHAYIAEHPGEWLELMGRKVRNFWNAFQYDDISVITLLQERGVLLPGLRWGLVAALGLTGLALVWGCRSPGRWVAAAVLLHMLALLPVFVTERYRLAAAPGLIVLGVYALGRLWRALQAREWRLAGLVGLLGAAAALFVSQPVFDQSLWSLEPLNLGVKELDLAETLPLEPGTPEDREANAQEAAAELRRAEAHLHRAYAWAQGDPGITFALGNLAIDQKDLEHAKRWYRRTLELNPRFTGALNNLGFLAMQEKQWLVAERFFLAAAASEPDSAKSYYLLALAREQQGELDRARSAIAHALTLSPHQAEFLELSQRLNAPPSP